TLIDGSYYYFKNGKPYTGWVGDYYINEGIMKTDMVVGNYYVGSDGKYVKNQWAGKELTYYAKSDGKLARDEWLKLNGSWYYFSAIHKVTGVFVVDGKVYQFDNDGKLTATLSSSVKNGWLKAGSTYAYIKNGQAVRSGRVVDGNNIYYMDEAGLMLKDTVYDGYYYNASGKWEVITGWKKSDGKWYYFDHKGYSKRSFISDGGKTYLLDAYFTNGMATGWVTYYSKLYHFASNGVLDKTITPTESGWIKKDSSWFYYDAKIGYFYGWDEGSELYAIDGKEYGFDRYGRLVKNTVCFAADNRYYFCGSDGSVTRTAGWKTDASGKRWYTDANGRVLEGIQIIDGKTYYFDILFLEYSY
ncbi:MAG: hypothetical protein II704_08370, partial [Erysipelotrichaceae bacterium]|nr:hypothetical protein [Erysipelotrichaceae bacterium]